LRQTRRSCQTCCSENWRFRIKANVRTSRSCRKFSSSQNRVFALCYACWTSREKLVMETRFAFTLARLLVGGYMLGACVLVTHALAQQPVYTPGPPVPTAPGSNVPPPIPTAPESSITPPVNEPPSAARTHERRSVAKRVHRRGRSIFVAARTPPYYVRSYLDPSGALLLFCPVWNHPYDPDRCQWRWVGGLSGP
jgi:hypothetical protein